MGHEVATTLDLAPSILLNWTLRRCKFDNCALAIPAGGRLWKISVGREVWFVDRPYLPFFNSLTILSLISVGSRRSIVAITNTASPSDALAHFFPINSFSRESRLSSGVLSLPLYSTTSSRPSSISATKSG